MRNWIKDTILSIVLIAISTVTYTAASLYPNIASHFPTKLAFILGGLSVILLFKSIFITRAKDTTSQADSASFIGVLTVTLAVVIYIVAMKYIGYLITSFCLLIFVISFLGFSQKIRLLFVSLICVLVIYGVFNTLLGVPLPEGFFFQG